MAYIGENFACGPQIGQWVGPTDPRLRRVGRVIPAKWFPSSTRLPSARLVGFGYLLRILFLVCFGELPLSRIIPEMTAWMCRRWRLASSIGAQTDTEELEAYHALGWDHPVLLYRDRLCFFEKLIRFVHRGNRWRLDILDVGGVDPKNIVKLF